MSEFDFLCQKSARRVSSLSAIGRKRNDYRTSCIRSSYDVIQPFVEVMLLAALQGLLALVADKMRSWYAARRAKASERKAHAADEARQAREKGDAPAAAKADAEFATSDQELRTLGETEQAILQTIAGVAAELPEVVSRAVRDAQKLLPPPEAGPRASRLRGTRQKKLPLSH
jgi:hypothetical protein